MTPESIVRRPLGVRRGHEYSGLGALAQLGERVLCKHEVTGSSPVRSILVTYRVPLVYGTRDTCLPQRRKHTHGYVSGRVSEGDRVMLRTNTTPKLCRQRERSTPDRAFVLLNGRKFSSRPLGNQTSPDRVPPPACRVGGRRQDPAGQRPGHHHGERGNRRVLAVRGAGDLAR